MERVSQVSKFAFESPFLKWFYFLVLFALLSYARYLEPFNIAFNVPSIKPLEMVVKRRALLQGWFLCMGFVCLANVPNLVSRQLSLLSNLQHFLDFLFLTFFKHFAFYFLNIFCRLFHILTLNFCSQKISIIQ